MHLLYIFIILLAAPFTKQIHAAVIHQKDISPLNLSEKQKNKKKIFKQFKKLVRSKRKNDATSLHSDLMITCTFACAHVYHTVDLLPTKRHSHIKYDMLYAEEHILDTLKDIFTAYPLKDENEVEKIKKTLNPLLHQLNEDKAKRIIQQLNTLPDTTRPSASFPQIGQLIGSVHNLPAWFCEKQYVHEFLDLVITQPNDQTIVQNQKQRPSVSLNNWHIKDFNQLSNNIIAIGLKYNKLTNKLSKPEIATIVLYNYALLLHFKSGLIPQQNTFYLTSPDTLEASLTGFISIANYYQQSLSCKQADMDTKIAHTLIAQQCYEATTLFARKLWALRKKNIFESYCQLGKIIYPETTPLQYSTLYIQLVDKKYIPGINENEIRNIFQKECDT